MVGLPVWMKDQATIVFMEVSMKNKHLVLFIVIGLFFIGANGGYAIIEKVSKNELEKLEFRDAELYLSQTNVPLGDVLNKLSNRGEWQKFLDTNKGSVVYSDPRSGRPVTIVTAIPIIPGTGNSNYLTMLDISKRTGYEVKEITEREVKQLIITMLRDNVDLLGLNMDEIGEIRIGNPVDYLWHISVSRAVQGIPVRDAYISFAINHGNLVLWGIEKWGDVEVSVVPSISEQEALKNGFALIGGKISGDEIIKSVHLEIVPVSLQ